MFVLIRLRTILHPILYLNYHLNKLCHIEVCINPPHSDLHVLAGAVCHPHVHVMGSPLKSPLSLCHCENSMGQNYSLLRDHSPKRINLTHICLSLYVFQLHIYSARLS